MSDKKNASALDQASDKAAETQQRVKHALQKVQGKKWSDLPPQVRTRIIVQGIVQTILLIIALRDISRRPADQIRGRKWIWVLTSFVQPIGPIAYFVFGRKR